MTDPCNRDIFESKIPKYNLVGVHLNELPIGCCVLEYGRVTGEPGADGPSGGAPVGPGQHTQVWRRPKSGLNEFGIGQNVLLTYNLNSPLQVTIFGESAGSASVSHLILASGVTEGLFKGQNC